MSGTGDKKTMKDAYKSRVVIGGVGAVINKATGHMLLESAPEIEAKRNRFLLSRSSGNCLYPKLQEDWSKYGAANFEYEILERIEKPDEQPISDFAEDVLVLEEVIRERIGGSLLY